VTLIRDHIAKKRAFQYDLLSDPKRELIGLLTGSKTSTPRSHFVIDARGAVALSSIGVKPANSSPDALKFAQSL
jgi:peroxiredoxin Q/BCP